jgi:hypothetical protein
VVGLVHAALVIVVGWMALGISAEFAAGPYDAGPLFLPLAVVLVGAVRASRNLAGGRPILVMGDLSVAVLLGLHLATTTGPFLNFKPAWFAAAIGLALIAAASTIVLPRPTAARVIRTRSSAALLAALILVDVVATVVTATSAAERARIDVGGYLAQLAGLTVGFDLAIFAAWWWGARWPIAIGGIAGLIQVTASTIQPGSSLGEDPVQAVVAFAPYALAAVVGFIGPRVPLAPTSEMARPTSPRVYSRAATVWIGVGALLWPLLVLVGHAPPVTDLCFSCGPRFVGDELLASVGLLTILVVPVAALVALAWRTGQTRTRGLYPAILLGCAVVLAVEIVAGLLGIYRFGFLIYAAPPMILVGLGALVALPRPAALANTGWIAAFGAAWLAFVWSWGSHGGAALNSFVEVTFVLVSLGQAAAVAIGVAWESSRATAWATRQDGAGGTDPASQAGVN